MHHSAAQHSTAVWDEEEHNAIQWHVLSPFYACVLECRWSLVVGSLGRGSWVRLPGKHQYQLRREPKECKGKAVRCLVEAAERASEVLQLV